MAKNVSNNDTLEVLRTSYNDLVDEVGGLGGLRTSQKGSLVDAVNSIIDQYFFFQDFEYDGQDGTSSNRTFSGNDNFGESLKYSVNRVLVFKNGVLLRNGTDYSATNGTSITLASSDCKLRHYKNYILYRFIRRCCWCNSRCSNTMD